MNNFLQLSREAISKAAAKVMSPPETKASNLRIMPNTGRVVIASGEDADFVFNSHMEDANGSYHAGTV